VSIEIAVSAVLLQTPFGRDQKVAFTVLGILLGIGLVLSLIALIWWFRRISRPYPEVMAAVVKIWTIIQPAFEFAKLVWYFILIWLWLARFRVRKQIPSVVLWTFVVATPFTILEILLKLIDSRFHALVARHLLPLAHVLFLSPGKWTSFLQSANGFADAFYTSPWVLFLLLFIEALVLHHHFGEHKTRGRQDATLAALGELLEPLNRVNEDLRLANDPARRMAIQEDFWKTFFSPVFLRLLRERKIEDVDITIMEFKEETGLTIVYCSTDIEKFDHPLTLAVGQGGAGKALASSNPVYIPWIKYQHGIAILSNRYSILINAYFKTVKHPFKCMLCLPITDSKALQPNGLPKVTGVLNLSSPRRSAFSPSDFALAVLAAKILGLLQAQKPDIIEG
jgi:hypothetical protein